MYMTSYENMCVKKKQLIKRRRILNVQATLHFLRPFCMVCDENNRKKDNQLQRKGFLTGFCL